MKILKPRDVAKLFGVTVRTLKNWDEKDFLKAYRNPANRRYYIEEEVMILFKQLCQNDNIIKVSM
mgnify:CR=1 FL=1